MRDWERILILLSILRGIRSMAELEAKAGSATWAKCVEFIDKTMEEVQQ